MMIMYIDDFWISVFTFFSAKDVFEIKFPCLPVNVVVATLANL
jgi:hypothetical protein